MGTLFEKFILNYYRNHYNYEIRSRNYEWNLISVADSEWSYIPRMETDVQILMEEEHIIIDANYYRSAFTNNCGKSSFRSGHMYQLKAYMDKIKDSSKKVRGILVYPSNGYDFYQQYKEPDGSIIAFKTINLAEDWQKVEQDLTDIFEKG